jgi:predicted Zn finger-like uncharacterized protein
MKIIITEGKIPKITYRLQCPHCGTVFTCDDRDIGTEEHQRTSYKCTDCPLCGNGVILKLADLKHADITD